MQQNNNCLILMATKTEAMLKRSKMSGRVLYDKYARSSNNELATELELRSSKISTNKTTTTMTKPDDQQVEAATEANTQRQPIITNKQCGDQLNGGHIFTISSCGAFAATGAPLLLILLTCQLSALASPAQRAVAGAPPVEAMQGKSASPPLTIDRFDANENNAGQQISAPLLRSPTTLAPRQSAASAQESSYLSPEEREQLMKSQEAHYEGAQGEKQQQSNGAPSMAYNQLATGEQQAAPLGLQSEASNNESGANGDEDSDYNDNENQENLNSSGPVRGSEFNDLSAITHTRNFNRPTQVPNNRRLLALANSKQEHQHVGNSNNNNKLIDDNDDSEQPNNEQDLNEDAYFNRNQPEANQLNANLANQLNLAASYNQNQRERQPYQQQQQDSETQQGAGFGPGPNEAYLAEQAAENGGDDVQDAASAGVEDPDDESGVDANDPDEAPPAAMTEELNEGARNSLDPSPDTPQSIDQGVTGDSSTAASSLGPSNLNGETFAAASSRAQGQRFTPEPLVVPSELELAQRRRQQQMAQLEWQQARLRQNPHLLLQQLNNSSANSSQQQEQQQQQSLVGAATHYQATTTQAPYNPQNNPSHAGKYFIN